MKIISKPIEMIAIYNVDDTVKPVRFRLNNEYESKQVIKVETIKTHDRLKIDKRLYSIFN